MTVTVDNKHINQFCWRGGYLQSWMMGKYYYQSRVLGSRTHNFKNKYSFVYIFKWWKIFLNKKKPFSITAISVVQLNEIWKNLDFTTMFYFAGLPFGFKGSLFNFE